MRNSAIFAGGALVALLIQTAIAQMNPGVIQLNHVGVAVADMDESIALLSDIFDPQGVRIELSEYPPDSLQGQALAGEI